MWPGRRLHGRDWHSGFPGKPATAWGVGVSKARVLVAVPVSADGRPSCWTAEAVANLRGTHPEQFVEARIRPMGSTFLVREAIGEWIRADRRFTHTLMVDSDVGFVPEDAMRLLAHHLHLVCGVYVTKDAMPTPVTYYEGPDGLLRPMLGRKLEKIDKGGLGFALISREVFEGTPKPWFAHCAEDLEFFRVTKAAGFQAWCDFGVRVKHWGERAYTVEDAEATATRLGLVAGITPPDADRLLTGDAVRMAEIRAKG